MKNVYNRQRILKTQRLHTRAKQVDEESVRVSIVRMITRYAEQSPYFLNPDKVVVENVIAGLVRNRVKYGYAYCPCREVEEIAEKDKHNICPCRSHREEIARHGTCECGLFVSRGYLEAKQSEHI